MPHQHKINTAVSSQYVDNVIFFIVLKLFKTSGHILQRVTNLTCMKACDPLLKKMLIIAYYSLAGGPINK